MKAKANKANVVTLRADSAKAAISNAVKGATQGETACAECAQVLSAIVPNWAQFDGRKAKSNSAMKKHCSDLGITAAQGKEVQAWSKQMREEYATAYSTLRKAQGLPVTDALVTAACYAFIQSIKRHCPAYFTGKEESGKQAGKARGKAKASAPKAKAKAGAPKAKPEKEKTLAELYGASVKALQVGIAGFIPAFDHLMNARGIKGLSCDDLDRAKLLVSQACEIVGKIKS